MIRVIAICVFSDQGRILLAQGIDPSTGERFFRPLGGEVEFGERAADAVRREIREELALEIEAPNLTGVLENHFTYGGKASHEIVFVFDARFANPSVYASPEIPMVEAVWSGPAIWKRLDELHVGPQPVYPEGLLALLESQPASG